MRTWRLCLHFPAVAAPVLGGVSKKCRKSRQHLDLLNHLSHYLTYGYTVSNRIDQTLHTPSAEGVEMVDTVEFVLNNKPVQLQVEEDRMLLWVLRTDLGLMGTKFGCGIGACGTCTVLMNKEAVRSCQIPVADIKGKEILTIEGLAKNRILHPLQQAFVDHNAFQCGFCTPGMILNAYSLLMKNSAPTEAQIIAGMEDNLCRCGGYMRIVQAIQTAAKADEGVKR